MYEKWYDVEWTQKIGKYYYSHEEVFDSEEKASAKVMELSHNDSIITIMKFTIEKWKRG